MDKTTVYKNVWIKTFPGFYGTIFSPDLENLDLEDECIGNEIDIVDCFDNDAYETEVAYQMTALVQERLKERLSTVVKVEFERVDSPKWYNFGNDELIVSVSVVDEELFEKEVREWCIEHRDYIEKCLKKDFTMYSGYWPKYSSDYNEFMADLEMGTDAMDIIISYIFERNENGSKLRDIDMYYYVDVYPEQFIDIL